MEKSGEDKGKSLPVLIIYVINEIFAYLYISANHLLSSVVISLESPHMSLPNHKKAGMPGVWRGELT